MRILNATRESLLQAWKDSRPGTSEAHEEVGFILQHPDGTLTVERWPGGKLNQIEFPSHLGGMRESKRIVATFHTHPNPGPEFQQEPSLTDIRSVRDDEDLHHAEYEGEYVISSEIVYRIMPDGGVVSLGKTRELLGGG